MNKVGLDENEVKGKKKKVMVNCCQVCKAEVKVRSCLRGKRDRQDN